MVRPKLTQEFVDKIVAGKSKATLIKKEGDTGYEVVCDGLRVIFGEGATTVSFLDDYKELATTEFSSMSRGEVLTITGIKVTFDINISSV